MLLAIVVAGWFVLQWMDGPFKHFTYTWWPVFAWAYIGAFGLHWILTTRDGWVGMDGWMDGWKALSMSVLDMYNPGCMRAQCPDSDCLRLSAPKRLTAAGASIRIRAACQLPVVWRVAGGAVLRSYVISLTAALRMPAFIRASSARQDPQSWLMYPMHMKWKLFLQSALFW